MDIDLSVLHLDTTSLIVLTALALGWFLTLSVIEWWKKRKETKKSRRPPARK